MVLTVLFIQKNFWVIDLDKRSWEVLIAIKSSWEWKANLSRNSLIKKLVLSLSSELKVD